MSAGPAKLFPVAFRREIPFGRCVALDLTQAGKATRNELLSILRPAERAFAETVRGARLVEFVGGRLAARQAGCRNPVLKATNGAPHAEGFSLSISHSRQHALALVANDAALHVGIDIEPLDDDSDLDLLAERILAPQEHEESDELSVLERLSIKEAVWKALSSGGRPVPLRRIVIRRGHRHLPAIHIDGDDGAVAVSLYRVEGAIVSAAAVAPRCASSQPAARPSGNQKVSHAQSNGVR